MQVVEEVIDEAVDLHDSTDAGVLPLDRGVQQRLEKELGSARLQCARQMLWEEDYSSEGAGSATATRGVWRNPSWQGPTVLLTGSLNPLSVRVMCGVGLRSQRWLDILLEQQGFDKIQKELTMLGPWQGPTTTAARSRYRSQRSSGPICGRLSSRSDLYCRWRWCRSRRARWQRHESDGGYDGWCGGAGLRGGITSRGYSGH